MYKIYIKESQILICNEEMASDSLAEFHCKPFPRGENALKTILKDCEDNSETYVLFSEDPERAFDKFTALYKVIIAAGGLLHDENKILFIYRNGKWDLPKGKMEKGESVEETALREVSEEVGLQDIVILAEAGSTWHTYAQKGKKILKETSWYHMGLKSNVEILKPQREEGITECRWMSKNHFLSTHSDESYQSIVELLREQE